MENKYEILEHLLKAFQLTREHQDLQDLDYDVETEIVTANYKDGYKKHINVACDSGIAMIRDVLLGLYGI